MSLADVFYGEYRKALPLAFAADGEEQSHAVAQALEAVERTVRDSIARDFERIGWRPMTLQEIADVIRTGGTL